MVTQKPTRNKTVVAEGIDRDTGQVLDLEINMPDDKRQARRQSKAKERFFMGYMAALAALHEYGLSGRERDVLDQLVLAMGYNEPFLPPTPATIAKVLGISRSTAGSAIQRLRDLGILIDRDNGEVLLNPRLFWRGSDEERQKWIIALDSKKAWQAA